MSPTTAPARPRIDPRIGRRRAEVARAQGRRRLRVILAGVALLAAAVGALFVLHSPLFSARHVQVVGADRTGRAAVLRVAGLVGAPPLVDVDSGAAAARLEGLPWVGHAWVGRRWPDSVVVHVTERVPAVVLQGARLYPAGTSVLVDAAGRVLAGVRVPPMGLPVLSAPVHVGRPGTTLGPAAGPGLLVARAAARVIPGSVHGIQVAPDGAVRLDLGGGVVASLGPAASIDSKLTALASVLAGAAASGPEVIDVSVPGEPTVAPGGSGSA